MTLIIGIRCTDGLVMVADSMSTEAAPLNAGLLTKHETSEKIVAFKDIVWGASGSVGIKQLVQHELEKDYNGWFQRNTSAVEFRQKLVKKIQPVLKEQYRLGSDVLGQPRQPPLTNFIFGTYLKDGFTLVNIEADCAGEVVEACHCATGSGQKTGQALLRRLRNQIWDVKTALVVAYRTMNDAIHVEPMGIGPPIRLARCYLKNANTIVEKIDNDSAEFKAIADTARIWTEMEQETLNKLKVDGEQKAQPEVKPIPAPPAA